MTAVLLHLLSFVTCVTQCNVAHCSQLTIMLSLMNLQLILASLSVIWYVAIFISQFIAVSLLSSTSQSVDVLHLLNVFKTDVTVSHVPPFREMCDNN